VSERADRRYPQGGISRSREQTDETKQDPRYGRERDIIPRKRRKRCRESRRSCCDQLLDILKNMPGYEPDHHFKPKDPSKVKLSCLCDTWPTKDAMVPILFHILERFWEEKSPANEFERELFAYLETVPDPATEVIKDSWAAFQNMPESKRRCLFKQKYLDLPLDHALDAAEIAQAWLDEGAIFARDEIYDEPICVTGRIRPFEYEPIVVNGGSESFTAPVPFICSVNGIRKRDHRPPLDYYQPEEYDQQCQYSYDEDTGEVTESCQYKQWPSCEPGQGYHNNICLTIPTARAGQSADIVGFNFFSENCEVVLTHRDQPSITYRLPTTVCGDTDTPRAEADGTVIADCRVQDRISFLIPDTSPDGFGDFIPGTYWVDVVAPNGIGYTLADGYAPPEFSSADVSNTALLRIRPAAGLKYRIWSYKSHCYDETDGEWFSDEIWVKGVIAKFNLVGDEGQTDLRTDLPLLDEMSDADEGETWEFDWPILGDDLDPEEFLGSAAIALIGFEVDSEDAAKEAIKTWTDAFVEYIKKVWDLIKDRLDDIAKGLGSLGWKWGLIAAAIAVVVVVVIGAIWAAWAPPDMMLRDLIVLDEESLFNLTHPTSVLPASTIAEIQGVTIEQLPESKLAFLYTEERRYRSSSQGSEYGLWFGYQRED
jgi:hypothetical protein